MKNTVKGMLLPCLSLMQEEPRKKCLGIKSILSVAPTITWSSSTTAAAEKTQRSDVIQKMHISLWNEQDWNYKMLAKVNLTVVHRMPKSDA